MRPLNEIIVHCTDTRPEWGENMTPARVVDEIRRWHTDLGGHGGSAKDKFEDHFTPAQKFALLKLIDGLKAQYSTITKVTGHNQYAAKACPCFNVPAFMGGTAATPDRVTPTQSTTVQASAVQVASAAGAGLTAVSALSGTAQIVALAFCGIVVLSAAWIMRERLRKWANGDR